MLRFLVHLSHRDLMRTPIILSTPAIDFLGASPTFGGAQHDHRPARAFPCTIARVHLDALDVFHDGVKRRGHQLVHLFGVAALDEIGRIAIAAEELVELLVTDPGQDSGVRDFVTVQVQDRQNDPVGRRVQKLVGMPARRKRSGFRLAISDHARDNQIGVVERRAIGVRNSVAKFAALVDRPRCLRRHVARDAARKRELGEQALHAVFVGGDVGINLAVGPFEIGVGDKSRPTVAWAGDVDHVQVVLFYEPVQVNVDEVQPRCGSPVTEEPRLDVLFG